MSEAGHFGHLLQIQSHTSPPHRRRISTDENSADHLTRGLLVEAYLQGHMERRTFVFEGEKILNGSRSNHETATKEEKGEKARLQADCSIRGATMLAIQNNATLRPETGCFSTWIRPIKTLAWVYRFVNNCQLTRHRH